MATLTIRQVDERTHARLRTLAAAHGRSVEAEVRALIDAAVGRPDKNILMAVHDVAYPEGGVKLSIPTRDPAGEPVDFG